MLLSRVGLTLLKVSLSEVLPWVLHVAPCTWCLSAFIMTAIIRSRSMHSTFQESLRTQRLSRLASSVSETVALLQNGGLWQPGWDVMCCCVWRANSSKYWSVLCVIIHRTNSVISIENWLLHANKQL
jgi:hypothetical protein